MGEFFAMGGYALYVWGAWALSVLILAGNLAWIARCRRQAHATVRRMAARQTP